MKFFGYFSLALGILGIRKTYDLSGVILLLALPYAEILFWSYVILFHVRGILA